MRKRRPLRRWIVRAVVFLLLGAVVNVAVAWGFALRVDVFMNPGRKSYQFTDTRSVFIIDFTATGSKRTQVARSYGDYSRANGHTSGFSPDELLADWSHLRTTSESDGFTKFSRDVRWEDGRGWPLLSFMAIGKVENLTTRESSIKFGMVVESHPWRGRGGGYNEPRVIPLQPIWPGFAFNTAFYTVVLWLLLAAPFALRRWRRVRKRLCPKCAYPVGESAVCTECGTYVKRRNELRP